ncbi:MAG: alpha-L-rhamnosidase C-terminal domain-containing protein, partial [Bacteroidales bacterium]
AANYVGFIGFEVTGHEGQELDIVWNESLSPDGKTVRPIQGIEATQALRYIFREGRQRYLAFNPHLARYIRVVHRGKGEIILHRLWMVDHSFAVPPQGAFECSDSGLNNIYQAAVRTARLNTLDTFMDNPDRERGSWMREGYWMAQSVFYAFGDLSVSRRMVRYGADSQSASDHSGPPGMVQMLYPATNVHGGFIPAHALYWVLQAGLHNRYANDLPFTREIIPSVRKLVSAFETWENEKGLLENVDSWNFIDWTDIRTDGISVALNAIYARTLDEVALMETSMGESSRAAKMKKKAAQVREALNQFCTGDGFYPDALLSLDDGSYKPSPEMCEATQYFILWAEVPPPDRHEALWKILSEKFRPTPGNDQPIMGLPRAGLYSFFERLQVAAREKDYHIFIDDVKTMFLHMAESSPGTLWEHPQRQWCLCQGFSSGVAALLTEEILGIRIDKKILISPHDAGKLSWCRGHLNVPQGRIEVAWSRKEESYTLKVSIPAGMQAEVILPPGAEEIWKKKDTKETCPERFIVSGEKVIVVHPGYLGLK